MRSDIVGPDDKVVPYVDPIYTPDNRHLPKMFDFIKNAITDEEAESLREFIEQKLSEEREDLEASQSMVLAYRPDEWDSAGVIAKIQDLAKLHIQNTYSLGGYLGAQKFMLLRTENAQSYKEVYGNYNNDGEILYTAIVSPCRGTEYFQGETKYTINGEGFKPRAVDMTVHRNEELNNWEITEVINGTRFDLVIVFQEVDKQVSYDYEIDQTIAEGLSAF